MGGCVAFLETGLRREASSLLPPPVCPSRNVLQAHPRQRSDRAHDAPPEAELPPPEGICCHQPTNRGAPRGAHGNLPELSCKVSCPRDTGTSNYNTQLQQCISRAQPNKPMTATVLLELSRQSAVTPPFLRGLGGLRQHSPSPPLSAPWTLHHVCSLFRPVRDLPPKSSVEKTRQSIPRSRVLLLGNRPSTKSPKSPST